MRPTTGAQPAPRFGAGLHFLTEAALDETLPDLQDRLLGGVAFGTAPGTPDIDAPFLAVPMPLAGGTGGGFEVLLSAQPVRAEKLDGVATARSDEVLFACLEFDDDAPDYEAAVRAAYLRAFRAIDHFGYPHLLRVWNYLPDIHRDRDGLERYRRFSLGRHEAFVAAGRDIARDAPAASAVGHGGGRAALCLLAARRTSSAPGVTRRSMARAARPSRARWSRAGATACSSTCRAPPALSVTRAATRATSNARPRRPSPTCRR
jgi:hypothetical protein